MVSLQIDKRRKERAEAEKKRAALKDLGDDSDLDEEEDVESDSTTVAKVTPVAKKKDVYLTETSRIVADLVMIKNEPELAGTKKKR